MESIPQIINKDVIVREAFPYLDEREAEYIDEAKQLIGCGMYSYS